MPTFVRRVRCSDVNRPDLSIEAKQIAALLPEPQVAVGTALANAQLLTSRQPRAAHTILLIPFLRVAVQSKMRRPKPAVKLADPLIVDFGRLA